MDGDAEVIYYPEAPEESYISLEELHRSSRENLRRLLEAVRRRSGADCATTSQTENMRSKMSSRAP